MSEPKLKPCPFCGEREDIRTIPWDPCIQVYIVWCGKCRCDGPEAVTGEEARRLVDYQQRFKNLVERAKAWRETE